MLIYTENFSVCHFFSQLFPAAYALRASPKLLPTPQVDFVGTLRESARYKISTK